MSNYTPMADHVNTANSERRSCAGLRCNTPAQQAARRMTREQKAAALAQRIAADLAVEERRSVLYRQRATDEYQAQRQAALVAGGATWRAFVDAEMCAERAVYDEHASEDAEFAAVQQERSDRRMDLRQF